MLQAMKSATHITVPEIFIATYHTANLVLKLFHSGLATEV